MTESTAMVIEVEQRSAVGSSAVGSLRREGKVPGVIYGGGRQPVAIAVVQRSLEDILKQGGHHILRLHIGGLSGDEAQGDAMIKEIQADPISGLPLHVDFLRIEKGHKVHITIRVVVKGDSIGVRHGGRLDFPSRELALEVLPREIIDQIEVDVSELEIGKHVTVADLAPLLPPSGKLLEDPHRVVVLIEKPRAAVEEAAAPAAVAGEQAEPELIRTRGKVEEEAE